MILAAGEGTRLRPLTNEIPKPLIRVGQQSLIERHLQRLANAGFTHIVINVRYKKQLLIDTLGDGINYGIKIIYSEETDAVLDTGGGIKRALPLLGNDVFLAINADVYTDWEPGRFDLPEDKQAHLLLVENPPHNPGGDFSLDDGIATLAHKNRLTYAGIGYYRPALFATTSKDRFKLAQLLNPAAAQGKVSGERCHDFWMDAGTLQSLAELRQKICQENQAEKRVRVEPPEKP